jgi:hypothetical protein
MYTVHTYKNSIYQRTHLAYMYVLYTQVHSFSSFSCVLSKVVNCVLQVNVFLQHNYRQGEISNTGLPLGKY